VLCNKPVCELLHITELIYDKIDATQKTGNYFDQQSELSLVNRTAFEHPVKVSSELFSIINKCLYYNKLTSGYFDVTVHSDSHNNKTISQLSLDKNKSTISFHQKGLKINLSGFLKGYVLDSIQTILSEYDITNALINIGNSSIMAKGNHPYGKGWKVGINKDCDKYSEKNIVLINQCLTTSGNEKPERKHIINPFTNNYIEGMKQISVITDNATDGEALSTALFSALPVHKEIILNRFDALIFDY
jgi:thiamine biosynthesis lipoprotein